jgi:hypothetical protein
VTRPRVFLDSCVLIEGLVAPWSGSRGVLILGRTALFKFALADIVVEETERALLARVGAGYGGAQRLRDDLALLLGRLDVERIPHASVAEVERVRTWIRHRADVPVLAAAVQARPDWFLTDNVGHFNAAVSARSGLTIATPGRFLQEAGKLFQR